MYQISEETKQFYKDNPGMLKIRLKFAEDNLRIELKDYSKERTKQIMDRFYEMWSHSLETDFFPDEEDIIKLL